MSLMDVIRLTPRAEAGSNEAHFGMALRPAWNRAFRADLIAPGADMTWRVASIFLRAPVASNAPFVDLAGRDVILTGDARDDDLAGAE